MGDCFDDFISTTTGFVRRATVIKKLATYLLVGLVFFAVTEYMFSVIIRGDHSNFLGSIVFNTIYLTFVFFSSKLIDRLLGRWGIEDIVIYFVYGSIGLAIEWFLVGNSPWGNPDASQVTMFSYWAGAVMMARIFTNNGKGLSRIRGAILLFFIPYSVLSVTLGHCLPTDELRFVTMILLAIAGYNLMNGFYIWYVIHRFTSNSRIKLPANCKNRYEA